MILAGHWQFWKLLGCFIKQSPPLSIAEIRSMNSGSKRRHQSLPHKNSQSFFEIENSFIFNILNLFVELELGFDCPHLRELRLLLNYKEARATN